MKRALWVAASLITLTVGCKKDNKTSLAVVTTSAASSITSTSAQVGATIVSNGGSIISQSGVCWALKSNPSLSDSVTVSGATSGAFTSSLSNLNPNTTYYYRAYAINGMGTGYGVIDSFATAMGIPTVTTVAISNNAALTAQSGGIITNNGGAPVTASGVCWSTSANPTISNSKTVSSVATGSFSDTLDNLTYGLTYYVRAYATNSYGIAYGGQVSFAVSATGTVTDFDGNVYGTITIGTQTWMTSNLKVTHYTNGDAIINALTSLDLDTVATTGAYTFPNGDTSTNMTYGKLYTIGAVIDPRGIAPAGWHVPSDSDWYTLEYYEGLTASDVAVNRHDLGLRGSIGGNLLQGGSSGLALQLPGFFCPGCGEYSAFGINGLYWSSTDYRGSGLNVYREFNESGPGPIDREYGNLPISVRLIKD